MAQKGDLLDYARLRHYRHIGINETKYFSWSTTALSSIFVDVTPLYYSQMELAARLDYHHGCVNSIDWDESGQFLLSGSDDACIALWNCGEAEHPVLQAAVGTGHQANIFSARFFPASGSRFVATASGDDDVKLFAITDAEIDFVHSYECFKRRAKRVDFDWRDPNWFAVVSEDATVRHYDRRMAGHQCRSQGSQCPAIILDGSSHDLEFTTISVSPCRPEYFAVGGAEGVVRIYDRRRVTGSVDDYAYAVTELDSPKRMISGVRFAEDSMDLLASYMDGKIFMSNPWDPREPVQFAFPAKAQLSGLHGLANGSSTKVAASLLALEEHYRQAMQLQDDQKYALAVLKWADVLKALVPFADITEWRRSLAMIYWNRALAKLHHASMCEGDIDEDALSDEQASFDTVDVNLAKVRELFSTFKADETFLFEALLAMHKGMLMRARHLLVEHLLKDNTEPCVDHHSDDRSQLVDEASMSAVQRVGLDLLTRILRPMLLREAERRFSWHQLGDFVNFFRPVDLIATDTHQSIRAQRHVITTSSRVFSLHVNRQTVKDVSFIGLRSELVASGSDGGLAYIWNRHTGNLVWLAKADNHAINSIQVPRWFLFVGTSDVARSCHMRDRRRRQALAIHNDQQW